MQGLFSFGAEYWLQAQRWESICDCMHYVLNHCLIMSPCIMWARTLHSFAAVSEHMGKPGHRLSLLSKHVE